MGNSEIKKIINSKLKDEIDYVTEVDEFLGDLVTPKYISPKFFNDFLISDLGSLLILRRWNSYYPSFYNVTGGCYVIRFGSRYIIIDPGYKTVQTLFENNIDTRLIEYIIITHDHPDHVGGLKELLDILFKQRSKHKITLFINPGYLSEYKHYQKGDSPFRVKEIKNGQIFFLKSTKGSFDHMYELSFKGRKVHHSGIKKKQKTMSLLFEIKDFITKKKRHKILNDTLKFGVSSDLDGYRKYIKNYQKYFKNLFFLLVHLGSLKHEEEISKKKKEDKHLYAEGLYRLIENIGTVKSFVLQEFGLEMSPPKNLSNILSKKILKNGYFLPYLIFNYYISKHTKKINKILFPLLLSNFLLNFKIKKPDGFTRIERKVFNFKKLFEFGQVLTLDLETADVNKDDKKLNNVLQVNIWDCEKLTPDSINKLEDIFCQIWEHLRKNLYLGISNVNFKKVESISSNIDIIFPKDNFLEIIKFSSNILVELIPNDSRKKIIAHFEELFKEKEFKYPYELRKTFIYLGRRIFTIDTKYLSAINDNEILLKFQIFPVLLFLSVLVNSDLTKIKIPEKNIKMKTQESFKGFFPNVKIYLGDYGNEIFFDTYFRSSYKCLKCESISECKENRNGNFLFTHPKNCIKEIIQREYEQTLYQELYEYEQEKLFEEHQEILEKEKEEKKKKKIEQTIIVNYFSELLKNQQLDEAVLYLNKNKKNLPFKTDYIQYLKDIKNTEIRRILFIFSFNQIHLIEFLEDYVNLYKKIYEIIKFYIKNSEKEKILNFLKYNDRLLRGHNIKRLFNDKSSRTLILRSTYLRILLKIFIFFCQKHLDFNDNDFQSVFFYLNNLSRINNKKIKMALRNIFYYNYIFDDRSKKSLDFFKSIFEQHNIMMYRILLEKLI